MADDSASGSSPRRAISPRAKVSAKAALGAMVKTDGCFTPPTSRRGQRSEGALRLVARLGRADMNPGPVQHGAEQPSRRDGAVPHDVGGKGAGRGSCEQAGMGDLHAGISISDAFILGVAGAPQASVRLQHEITRALIAQ